EKLSAFLLRCARLALSLHPQTIQRTDLAACNLSKTMLKLAATAGRVGRHARQTHDNGKAESQLCLFPPCENRLIFLTPLF
ncbi:MAG: hypothetical protein ACI3YD_00290, partial [Alloprevotella sp.]